MNRHAEKYPNFYSQTEKARNSALKRKEPYTDNKSNGLNIVFDFQ